MGREAVTTANLQKHQGVSPRKRLIFFKNFSFKFNEILKILT